MFVLTNTYKYAYVCFHHINTEICSYLIQIFEHAWAILTSTFMRKVLSKNKFLGMAGPANPSMELL